MALPICGLKCGRSAGLSPLSLRARDSLYLYASHLETLCERIDDVERKEVGGSQLTAEISVRLKSGLDLLPQYTTISTTK